MEVDVTERILRLDTKEKGTEHLPMQEPRARIVRSIAYAYNIGIVRTGINNIPHYREWVRRQIALTSALNHPEVVLNHETPLAAFHP